MNKKIKLFDPSIDQSEEKSIIKVLQSKFWASGSGTGNVKIFENKFKKYVGSTDCVAVNSGTSALNLALSLMDIKNKEVIVPSLTFVSTIHAIKLNGGKPIFVDVDEKNLCIDAEQITQSITDKTKVILPVHFGGMPCDLSKIKKICKDYDLTRIEDAAHASGSTYKNQKIGKHSSAVCFSFHPVKNLAMPTGGLISLNGKSSKKFKKILESRRWCGITNRHDSFYDVQEMGWNYYMNEFSAAIGIIQLKKLDKLNIKRKKIAKLYSKKINLEQKMIFDENCSYHLYWIRVKNRNQFRKKMNQIGIETGIHYRPVHTFSMYKTNSHLPVTEKVGNEIVSIPIHPNLSNDQIYKIIDVVNEFS
ncbi:MAG: DegT/DnrJ/EryC1/StrS family aminotransferase [Nitrosopumilus sp.]|uniref:DegT/DnrJ/EryC1/StrS family aminotransferase n=1 Tax=Nitrosopumilus sp. TaxID=2024843 RepID=UPI00242A3655|nr:DegT/DnrJ/EryC1/StrS family aminotransferase [Nitrosopumilus sp.]MCV0366647.1 DegT/DnrJ/EryC1/StrS family aminotransferase [Nitrosopumilus sp.]